MSSVIDSGLKLFDIIKILANSPSSRNEICSLLNEKGINTDKNTISKYIKTLRKSGFEIIFENKKYQILKTPFKTALTPEESRGFYAFLKLAEIFFKGKCKNRYNSTKYKLENLIEADNENQTKNINLNFSAQYMNETSIDNIIKLNEYILNGPSKIKIKYNSKWYIVIPNEIKYKQNGFFLFCKNEPRKKNKIFKIDLIKNIKFIKNLDEREILYLDKTVFKITGKLKKNYLPKEGEILSYEKNGMFVTSMLEDKEALFNRLLKYGNSCEVVFPEKDRKKFINKLKALLKHYKSM